VPALSPFLRKERQKLARGNAVIDARIDLHGMTQAEAHGALRKLLHRSQASGAKFVLVITGKGAPGASRSDRGVLRRQVPMWLALPEFRRYVLGFDVADTGHGGEGALYVRLRKAKV
jgi:DNA-nicking Smr family endonuclease